jgi:hypothetical protein
MELIDGKGVHCYWSMVIGGMGFRVLEIRGRGVNE